MKKILLITILSSVLFLTACGDNESSKSTICDKFQPIYNDFNNDKITRSELYTKLDKAYNDSNCSKDNSTICKDIKNILDDINNDFYDDITIKSQLTYINMDCQKEKGE